MSNPGQYRNSGYKRVGRDFYPTPSEYVVWLLQNWQPDSLNVLEPCAGDGDMVRVLQMHGYNVTAEDVATGQDVLQRVDSVDCIITNTPYGRLGPQIARHMLTISSQVALLFPYDWDAAGSRADMFSIESPFRMKININQRVKWIPDSETSGMHNYAWYIWDQKWKAREAVMRQAPHGGAVQGQ